MSSILKHTDRFYFNINNPYLLKPREYSNSLPISSLCHLFVDFSDKIQLLEPNTLIRIQEELLYTIYHV